MTAYAAFLAGLMNCLRSTVKRYDYLASPITIVRQRTDTIFDCEKALVFAYRNSEGLTDLIQASDTAMYRHQARRPDPPYIAELPIGMEA